MPPLPLLCRHPAARPFPARLCAAAASAAPQMFQVQPYTPPNWASKLGLVGRCLACLVLQQPAARAQRWPLLLLLPCLPQSPWWRMGSVESAVTQSSRCIGPPSADPTSPPLLMMCCAAAV